MKNLLKSLLSEDLNSVAFKAEDQKSSIKILIFIFFLLICIIFWDKYQLHFDFTPLYFFIKGSCLFSILFCIGLWIKNKDITSGLLLFTFSMFNYSLYGILNIHFTYCYSFWEVCLVLSFFFRTSKKIYLSLMLYGAVLNIIGIYFASEPDFIKSGMSFKPHITFVTFVIYFLSILIYLNITKKKEDLYKMHEKFAIIGKQSSFIFHEIKKPINRLINDSQFYHNDLQQINNIMLNMELMLKNPISFTQSFSQFDIKNIFIKIELDFVHFFREYNINFFYPKESLVLFANEPLMFQVFKNLTMNSIEAIASQNQTSERSIITINYDNQKIQYKNTGSKILASNIETIFDPFYSTKIGGSNNGLGLSFCKNIIEGHKWKIKIKSEKDGPLFTIFFN